MKFVLKFGLFLISSGEPQLMTYLDTYGDTAKEVTWTRKRFNAFRMRHDQASIILSRIKKFHPAAKIQPYTTK